MRWRRRSRPVIDWTCIVCGAQHQQDAAPFDAATREAMLCEECGSTWRIRAVLMAVMIGLGHRPGPFSNLACDWSRRGVGLSDPPPLSSVLPSRVSYTNTYYDGFPQLDITRPPELLAGQLDFIVCSDVLEHVPPPLDAALSGLLFCLRPNGFAVVTVPVGAEPIEFYPGLRDFELRSNAEDVVLEWTGADGVRHVDRDPERHDGGGLTLAFRLCSVEDLIDRSILAGFTSVSQPDPALELGVPEIPHPGLFLMRKADSREY